MAAPLRSPELAPHRGRTAALEVLPTAGRPAPSAASAARLRVVGAPELLSDDDHPDFHHLPSRRGRR